MSHDDVPTDEPTDSAACWAELRTAMQQLETSMTDLQDAVTGLDSAFANVEQASTAEDGPAVTVEDADGAAVTDSAAGD